MPANRRPYIVLVASLDEHELGYKLTEIFMFQFCDVAIILAIIHKRN